MSASRLSRRFNHRRRCQIWAKWVSRQKSAQKQEKAKMVAQWVSSFLQTEMAVEILSPNPQLLYSFSLLSKLSYREVRQPQSWLRTATKPKRQVEVGVSIQEPQPFFFGWLLHFPWFICPLCSWPVVAHQTFGEIQGIALIWRNGFGFFSGEISKNDHGDVSLKV